jgi:hypothetical protein
MSAKDIELLFHMLVPPVKERTGRGILIWLLEISVRLSVCWFAIKVLGFHVDIGIG